jgi:hypothetical protein
MAPNPISAPRPESRSSTGLPLPSPDNPESVGREDSRGHQTMALCRIRGTDFRPRRGAPLGNRVERTEFEKEEQQQIRPRFAFHLPF